MSAKKKQHYLAEAYLAGFCEGGEAGKLAVFDRKRQQFREQRPREVANENYFYSFTDSTGQRNSDMEENLQDIESKAMPCIQKLRAEGRLTRDERWHLSVFLATLTTRVPEFRASVQNVYRGLAEAVEKITTAAAIPVDAARELVDKIKASSADPELMQKNFLTLLLSTAEGFGRLLFGGNWEILKAPPGSSFVTSDNPVVRITPPRQGPYGVGVLSPSVLKTIPIASDTALKIFGVGTGYTTTPLDETTIRDWNLLIAGYPTTSLVIAREKVIIKDLFVDAHLGNEPDEGAMITVSPLLPVDDDR